VTSIDFHSKVADKAHHACRLLRKARAANTRCVVYWTDQAALHALDQLLWTFSPLDFLPHTMLGTPDAAQAPIVLTGHVADTPHTDLLVNLDRATPTFFSRFERVIEIVGDDEDDRLAGRVRWNFYKERGYALSHHDLSKG
jgi:DNA polymerase-3 subunit chi